MITLSECIDGYELAASARRLSGNTIQSYLNAYRKLIGFLGDVPIISIKKADIERFFNSQDQVSRATILKYHIALSALWSWALQEGFVSSNIMQQIPRPRVERTDILPFSESEIRALLSCVSRSAAYVRAGKRESCHSLRDSLRNRAILLTLIDTGIRASELCQLQIRHALLRNQEKLLFIEHGKRDKSRHVPISPSTAQAIWKYLSTRPQARLEDPLFATSSGRPINRYNLKNMLLALGRRAGVPNVHPHRFRHTFAINYLRNGGDVYTLQAILGHEDLQTCLQYLKIARTDVEAGHRIASPVEKWKL